jgi:ferritin
MKMNRLSKEYKELIQKAIGFEFDASNSYKQISNYMQYVGYFGAAKYFQGEAADELTHAQVWVDFVNDVGGVADIPAVVAPAHRPMSLMEAFTIYLNKEVTLGKFYNEWYEECEDATVCQQLLFFVKKQRKSVGEAGDLISTLERCENNPAALLLFDKELLG